MEIRECLWLLEEGKCHIHPKDEPISLTPVPGKAMEQVLLETVSKQVKQVTGKSQHAFTNGKQCQTKLITSLSKTSGDMGRTVNVVYLDFSKVFDAVSLSLHPGCMAGL